MNEVVYIALLLPSTNVVATKEQHSGSLGLALIVGVVLVVVLSSFRDALIRKERAAEVVSYSDESLLEAVQPFAPSRAALPAERKVRKNVEMQSGLSDEEVHRRVVQIGRN